MNDYHLDPPAKVLAIDPGTTHSGFIVWDGSCIECGQIENNDLLKRLRDHDFPILRKVGIEMMASYGMAVGREVFETCVWIGRFMEATHIATDLILRRDIKLHLCGSVRAKDANIRQALIDKHGSPGTKKTPGRTYGVSGHVWAALAVADYVESRL